MDAALAFYTKWGARQHGLPASDPAAATFARLWADIFALPYLQLGYSDNYFGSLMKGHAHAAAIVISDNATVPASVLADMKNAVLRLTNNTDATGTSVVAATGMLLARAMGLEQSIPARRQGFFRSHTMLQTRIAAGGVAMVVGTTTALEAAAGGDWERAGEAAAAACASGASVLAGFRDAEASSNSGVWAGLYAGDYLSDMQGAFDACKQLAAALSAPGNRSALPSMETANLWYSWDFAWQGTPEVRAAYPLSQHFDPAVAFSVMPRMNCEWADVDSGACSPNPDGGVWAAGKGGRVTLQVMVSPTTAAGAGASTMEVRYTLDGTAPTSSSPAYVPGKPLSLDTLAKGGAVTITAAVFEDGTGKQLGATRISEWRAV